MILNRVRLYMYLKFILYLYFSNAFMNKECNLLITSETNAIFALKTCVTEATKSHKLQMHEFYYY